MAQSSKSAGGAVDNSGTWKPTAESKKKATGLRVWAVVLWVLGFGAQLGAIFGLLLNPNILVTASTAAADGTITAGSRFPDWAFWVLIGLLVVDAVLVIIGSQLWKRANQFDPASKKEPVRFFVQNQLGAIIPILCFLPVIILIFLNKNMDKTQKGWAGGVGIALAVAAVLLGVSWNPPSVEQYTADQMAVVQLLGEDHVFWAGGGQVSHVCENVPDLQNATTGISSGTTAEAVAAGKPRLTLELQSELKACGKAVPNNIDDIVNAIRAFRDGTATEFIIPSPDWTGVTGAPSSAQIDQLDSVIEQVQQSASAP